MWIAFLLLMQSPDNPKALTERLGQLMESTAAAVPGLVKTSAVLAENTKATLAKLQASPTNLPLNYEFLQEARAYLALVDAMPKPYPLPETPPETTQPATASEDAARPDHRECSRRRA